MKFVLVPLVLSAPALWLVLYKGHEYQPHSWLLLLSAAAAVSGCCCWAMAGCCCRCSSKLSTGFIWMTGSALNITPGNGSLSTPAEESHLHEGPGRHSDAHGFTDHARNIRHSLFWA